MMRKPPAPPPKPSVSLDDIRMFTAVFNLVKQAYVEPVDDKTLMQDAIRGLLSGLDPHSEYLDQRAMDQLSEDTSGSYDGLGLEVLTVDGTLRVVAPIDDTPAATRRHQAGRHHRAHRRQGDHDRKTRTSRSRCCAARTAAR